METIAKHCKDRVGFQKQSSSSRFYPIRVNVQWFLFMIFNKSFQACHTHFLAVF